MHRSLSHRPYTAACRSTRVAALSLLVLLAWSGLATAAVSARFDRAQVHEGETVTLVIESDSLAGSSPDLSALDADFDVLGTSSGSRIQIVNGRQSATRSWQVTLAPKRLGTIEVPPITVGGDTTRPLVLKVAEMPQDATGGPGDDLFLEVDLGGAGNSPVYVQQQVPVTVRLYSAVPLRGGELSEPRAEGAVLERLGDDLQYDSDRNGRDYDVIERHFSLSPERSGELRIPPITFTGELRTAGGGGPFGDDRLAQLFRDPLFDRFGGSPFDRGEPVRARSAAVTLHVLPQPDGFTGPHWLPAAALAIDDSWARDPPQLTRGEPAERTLTVTATGLAGSQIPEIAVAAPDSVRVYPEGAETETRTDGDQLFGISRQRVSVMPTSGGTLDFPEIRLRWWDVNAGEERVAVVPGRRLVAAGTVDAAAPAAAGPKSAADAGAASAADPDNETAAQLDRLQPAQRPALWLLGAGVLAVAGVWLWRRRASIMSGWRGAADGLRHSWGRAAAAVLPAHRERADGRRDDEGKGPARGAAGLGRAGGPPVSESLTALQTACAAQDARAAASALLALVQQLDGAAAPTSLSGIAARLAQAGTSSGQHAAAAVRGLEASLYGPASGDWDGPTLATSVQAALADLRPRTSASPGAEELLAPLYPHRG